MEDHKRDQASPVTKFTKQAKTDKKIKLFENSENYLRDFVFVGDVCEVHKQLLENKTSGIYNVGTGTATSFKSVAESIAKKYNATIETVPMPENLKGQYQEYTCADISKLSTVTDIKFSTVEEYINGKTD
jgi:ADP-L-glycero-D-manno-heptose 6-epimerase